MGLRFRKSFKVAPGVKVNVGKKSTGVSIGGKGAHISTNTSGRKATTVGIPGTGLSYTHSSGGSRNKKNHSSVEYDEEYYNDSEIEEDKLHTPNKALSIFFVIIGIALAVMGLLLLLVNLIFGAIIILIGVFFIRLGLTALRFLKENSNINEI